MKQLKQKIIGLTGLALIALTSSACSDATDAAQAARSAGWKKVEIYDTSLFFNLTCQEGEMAYRMRGLNPAGEQTNATVCCGYTTYKGCTIRF